MAYKVLNNDTAATLIKSFNSFASAYETETDKKKKKELKTELEGKAKKIQTTLDTDSGDYDKNATERYLNIDDRLARAVKAVNEAKVALANFAKTRSFSDAAKVNVLPALFTQLELEEKQDDTAYKAAQEAYRGNPGDFKAMEKIFGDKYIKSFRRIRQATIDEGKKFIQPKHQKIAQSKQVAEQMVKQLDILQAGAKAGLEDIKKSLIELAQGLKKTQTDENDKGSFCARVRLVERALGSIKTSSESENLSEGLVGTMQSNLDGMLEHIKGAKIVLDGWKQKVDLATKSVPKPSLKDPAVMKATEVFKSELGKMAEVAKGLPAHYKTGLGYVTKAKKKVGL